MTSLPKTFDFPDVQDFCRLALLFDRVVDQIAISRLQMFSVKEEDWTFQSMMKVLKVGITIRGNNFLFFVGRPFLAFLLLTLASTSMEWAIHGIIDKRFLWNYGHLIWLFRLLVLMALSFC